MSNEGAILRAGDPWDGHYRGSKYHCSPDGRLWWSMPTSQARVSATAGFADVAAAFLSLRPMGGSFRVTETGALVTKVEPYWETTYVGEYEIPLEFEHVDVLGNGVAPLDLWPAFYDGARYSYKRGELWWKNPDDFVWQKTRERIPIDLEERLLRVKPSGGSVRVTENGKVLALIEPQPLPKRLEPQYEALTNPQKRLIEVKVKRTQRVPIYLGEYHGGFTLHPPQILTDPLGPEEEADLMGFLMQYGRGVETTRPEPFDPDDALEDLIDDREADG